MSKIAASLLAVPTLCLAASATSAQSPAARIAEKMQDPATQKAMTAAVKAMAEAMLDIEMAPFRKAMEAAGGTKRAAEIDEHETVRDMAGPNAGKLPDEMAKRVPATMGAMGKMAGLFETMLPQMAEMAEDMGAAVEREAAKDSGAAEDDLPTARDTPPEA